MPRLSTLFATFLTLSVSIAPVLSLTPGVYTIEQQLPGQDNSYMSARFGYDKEISMSPRRERDGQQEWIVRQLTEDEFTITNGKFDCQLVKGTGASGRPSPICGDQGQLIVATPVFLARDSYTLDFDNGGRFYRNRSQQNVTLVTASDGPLEQADLPSVAFIFRPLTQ
ncbi:unnamed protein product [Rhizoctonia solani]|uniref:Ricin B lectin domain-containing protein n=1 Tax=Rhizoctonia solani TaxID=456999 RepID=A0A8H2XJ39_9AGAM|nr:unnamed protein product [Rhizoctonia solani]CAE6447990.1 unnamed protein product [Rhizoctonia solani]